MFVCLFQADNLVFKDRKLNIGPAVRKQVNVFSVDYKCIICIFNGNL